MMIVCDKEQLNVCLNLMNLLANVQDRNDLYTVWFPSFCS